MAKGKKKQPKAAAVPVPHKTPHAAATPHPHDDKPVWRFGRLDLDGPWGWRSLSPTDVDEVLAKLKNCESMTVGELYNRAGNKPIPVDSICKLARERLEEIEADDLDELWELRLSGKERVWGARTGHIFYLLWWDPNHTVCPSLLRNT